jgi:CRP/FNR family cyclic AMP-dependent transcriptional regulator
VDVPGLFEVLDEEDRRLVRQRCVRSRYGRNDFVFHAGEAGDCLHIVERGKVAVQVGGHFGEPLILTVLSVGDGFGEGALLASDHRRTASVIALERADTLMLRADDYVDLCRRRPPVNALLSAALAAQVRRLTDRIVELAETSGAQRVHRRLLELGALYGVRGTDGPIPLTQAHLAAMAMVKLRLVNRVIGEAKDQGIVEAQRGRIVVLDWERLAELAGTRDVWSHERR